jgi:anti-sigma factor RsiW
MKCNKARTLIPYYADNALSERERHSLENHLVVCEECNAEAVVYSEKLARLNNLMAASYDSCPRQPDLAANITTRLQEDSDRSRKGYGWLIEKRTLSTASAFAALLLVLTLALTALFSSIHSSSQQAHIDLRSGRQSAYIARPLEGGCVDASVSSRRFARIESPRTRWAR